MIKRLLVGTFVALVLAVLSAGVFVGYSLYQIQGLVNEVEEAEAAFRRTNVDFPYDGLTTDTIRLERFEAFRRVRHDIALRLGGGARAMLEDLAVKERRARQGERVGILSIMGTLRGHFRTQRSMATEMVRELRRERMSSREYRDWTLLLFESVRTRRDEDASCRALWERYVMAERFLLLFTSGLSPRRAPQRGLLDVAAMHDDHDGDDLDAHPPLPRPITLLDRPDEIGADAALLPDEALAELLADLRAAAVLRAPLPSGEPAAVGGTTGPDVDPMLGMTVEIPSWALLDLIIVEAEAGIMSRPQRLLEP